MSVHSSYISRWEKKYQTEGVEGIRLRYQGSKGYLSQKEKTAVIEWIQEKAERTLWEVIDHIENHYGIAYRSIQSYYDLLAKADMSWQKGKKSEAARWTGSLA